MRASLRRDLEARGHGIWQDIAALQGGRDWWTQIEAAPKSAALDHSVLVLTPSQCYDRWRFNTT
jgi:hypothetical protein